MQALGNWTYHTSDRLGGGGYADVYRCHRPNDPDTPFAIKILKNPKHQRTLQRELDALRILQGCAGVPQVYDHGRDANGKLCLVTNLLAGRRLDTLVKQAGPLDEHRTLSMAQKILQILEVAHGQDLLHKDITPGNILIDGTEVSLIDWGVSEPVGDGRAPHIRSKREYCAPEFFYYRHCKGSDFYSLAWVMVFALTGRQPYHFDIEKDPGYRVVAHVVERPILPELNHSTWKSVIENWLDKQSEVRTLIYKLEMLDQINKKNLSNIMEGKDYRQLTRELSFWHLGARLNIDYAAEIYYSSLTKSNL